MTLLLLQGDCSPLFHASANGHVEVVKALLTAGATLEDAGGVGRVLLRHDVHIP